MATSAAAGRCVRCCVLSSLHRHRPDGVEAVVMAVVHIDVLGGIAASLCNLGWFSFFFFSSVLSLAFQAPHQICSIPARDRCFCARTPWALPELVLYWPQLVVFVLLMHCRTRCVDQPWPTV